MAGVIFPPLAVMLSTEDASDAPRPPPPLPEAAGYGEGKLGLSSPSTAAGGAATFTRSWLCVPEALATQVLTAVRPAPAIPSPAPRRRPRAPRLGSLLLVHEITPLPWTRTNRPFMARDFFTTSSCRYDFLLDSCLLRLVLYWCSFPLKAPALVPDCSENK
jgi:hypothetical protein